MGTMTPSTHSACTHDRSRRTAIALRASVVASFLLVASPGLGWADWEFVGYSSTSVDARDGFAAMHAACQVDYAADSRACSSAELMKSPRVPSTSAISLVLPSIVAMEGSTVLDASGLFVAQGELSCRSLLQVHIVYDSTLPGFNVGTCSPGHVVACCERVVPAAIPAMSAVGPGGRALIVALMILALGAYGLRRERGPTSEALGA